MMQPLTELVEDMKEQLQARTQERVTNLNELRTFKANVKADVAQLDYIKRKAEHLTKKYPQVLNVYKTTADKALDQAETPPLQEEATKAFRQYHALKEHVHNLEGLVDEITEIKASAQRVYKEARNDYITLKARKVGRSLAYLVTGAACAGLLTASVLSKKSLDEYVTSTSQPTRIVEKTKTIEKIVTQRVPGPVRERVHTIVTTAKGAPSKVYDHLGDEKVGLGTYVIATDPAVQEERVYQVTLAEVDRHAVSTGKNPGNKQRRGDGRTPECRDGEHFEIIQLQNSANWPDPFEGIVGAYGHWFARYDSADRRLKRWGNGKSPFGLHGTNEPEKIGMGASHGCTRHENKVIAYMHDQGMLALGTPVVIKSGLFEHEKNGAVERMTAKKTRTQEELRAYAQRDTTKNLRPYTMMNGINQLNRRMHR